MNIDNFESIVKAKFLERDESVVLIEINDFSKWQDDHKSKLEELISSSPSRLILISCGPDYRNDTRRLQKIARESYLKKYMLEYQPNQKKINPAKFSKTPANVKIVIQSVEPKSVLPEDKSHTSTPRVRITPPRSPLLSESLKPSIIPESLILETSEVYEDKYKFKQPQIEKKLLKKFPEFMRSHLGVMLQCAGEVFDNEFSSNLANVLSSILNVKNKPIYFGLEFLTTKMTQQQFLQSPQAIKSLEKLASMSPAAQKWWERLVRSHFKKHEKNPDFDFVACFEAFYAFNEDLKQLNLVLPTEITFDDEIFEDFGIFLNRISTLVLNAPNPADQLTHLDGIPFGKDLGTSAQQVYRETFYLSSPSIRENFLLMGASWKEDTRVEDIRNCMVRIDRMELSDDLKKDSAHLFAKVCAEEKANLYAKSLKTFLDTLEGQLLAIKGEHADDKRKSLLQAFSGDAKLGDMEQVALLMKNASEMDEKELLAVHHCLASSGVQFADRLLTKVKKSNSTAEADSNECKDALRDFIKMLIGVSELGIDFNHYMLLMTATSGLDYIDNLQDPEFQNWVAQLKAYPQILAALSQVNLSKSAALPTLAELFGFTTTLVGRIKNNELQQANLMEGVLAALMSEFKTTVYGETDISNVSGLVIEGFKETISKFSFLFEEFDINPPEGHYDDYLKHYKKSGDYFVRDVNGKEKYVIPLFNTLSMIPSLPGLGGLKSSLNESISKLFREIGTLVSELEKPEPTFENICKHLGIITNIAEDELFGQSMLAGFKGEDFLPILLTGKPGMVNGIENRISIRFFGDITDNIREATFDGLYEDLATINRPGLNRDKILDWLKKFCDSRSILFFFKEMLVDHKVRPGVSRIVDRLELSESPAFQSFKISMNRLIDSLEVQPEGMHLSDAELLRVYERNISGISAYLESLKQIKERHPNEFIALFSRVESELTELDFAQKAKFLNLISHRSFSDASIYISIVKGCFDAATQTFDRNVKERALEGIGELMRETTAYDAAFCKGFLKMSFDHYLISDQPFFLDTLKRIKNLGLSLKEEDSFRNNLISILQKDPSLKTGIEKLLTFLSEEDAERNKINRKYSTFFVYMVSKVKSADDLNRVLSIKEKLLEGKISGTFENVAAIILKLQKEKSDDLEKQKEFDRKEVEYLEKILHLLSGKFSTEPVDKSQYLLNLFGVYPQPKVKQFLDVLNDSKIDLQAWCVNFGKNPCGRDYKQSQFVPNDVKQSIVQLKNMMADNMSLPQKTQTRLAIQMNYIASMEPKLSDLSREDLQKNASLLLREIRAMSEGSINSNLTKKEYESKTLELIAHMREVYKRTVGMMPHSTQILTLLLAMTDKDADQAASNLLMQIKTGEGKSLITPLLAICQWAKGSSVDICTSNRTLAEEGFRKYGKPFFDFFVDEKNESMIHTNWLKDEKEKLPKGDDDRSIRFAAMEDLALIRLDRPPSPKTHLIYDEVDTVLDKPVLYNLAYQETDEKANTFTEFLCDAVDKFVEKSEFKDVGSPQAWSEDEDVFQFKLYLRQTQTYHENSDCRKRVDVLTDLEIREWIDAMLTSKKLKQDTDFVIVKGTCVPLQDGVPKTGAYGNNVQQALHFLNSAKKGSLAGCKVSAPTKITKSQSATQMIKNYTGRLIGISGTLGEQADLNAAHHLFGTQAVEIPPHRENKRLRREPIFTNSSEDSLIKVRGVIDTKFKLDSQKTGKKRKIQVEEHDDDLSLEEHLKLYDQAKMKMEQSSTQPLLIIVDDYKKAKTMAAQLADYKEKGFTINCVEGNETLEELQSKLIAPAGNTRHITIATPHMGRGIDFTSLFNKGICLVSLATRPRTSRLEAQIEGRTARNGKDGEYIPIYQITSPKSAWSKIRFYVNWFISFFRGDAWQKSHWKSLVKDVNDHNHEDRVYVNAIDNIQTCALKHIREWERLLREINPDDVALEDTLKAWRSEFFTKLGTFEEPNIKISTANQAVERFQMQIEEYFKGFKMRYAEKASNLPPHSKPWVDREYFLSLELGDLLQEVRPMRTPNTTLGLQAIEMPNEGLIDFDLAMNDEGYARWYYSGDLDGFAKHEECVLAHIHEKLNDQNIQPTDGRSLSETITRLEAFHSYLDDLNLSAKKKLMGRPLFWEFQNLCEIGKKLGLPKYKEYHKEALSKVITTQFGLDECLSNLAKELAQASIWSMDSRAPLLSREKMLKASQDIYLAAKGVRLNNTPETRKKLYRTLWMHEQLIRNDVVIPIPVSNAVHPVTLFKDTLDTLKAMIDVPNEQDKENFYKAKQEVEMGVGWTEVVRSIQMEYMPDGRIKVQDKTGEATKFVDAQGSEGRFVGYRSPEKARLFLENEKNHLNNLLEPIYEMSELIAIQQFVNISVVNEEFLKTLKEYQEALIKKHGTCESDETKTQIDKFSKEIRLFLEKNESLSSNIQQLIDGVEDQLLACRNKRLMIEDDLNRFSNHYTASLFFNHEYNELNQQLTDQKKLEARLISKKTGIIDDLLSLKEELRKYLSHQLNVITSDWTSDHPQAEQLKKTFEEALRGLNSRQQQEKERTQYVIRTFENQKTVSAFFEDQKNKSDTELEDTPRSSGQVFKG